MMQWYGAWWSTYYFGSEQWTMYVFARYPIYIHLQRMNSQIYVASTQTWKLHPATKIVLSVCNNVPSVSIAQEIARYLCPIPKLDLTSMARSASFEEHGSTAMFPLAPCKDVTHKVEKDIRWGCRTAAVHLEIQEGISENCGIRRVSSTQPRTLAPICTKRMWRKNSQRSVWTILFNRVNTNRHFFWRLVVSYTLHGPLDFTFHI